MPGRPTVRITQRRSSNGANRSQRETLRSLGLGGIGRSVERPDSPELRGMVKAVRHLVATSGAESGDQGGQE